MDGPVDPARRGMSRATLTALVGIGPGFKRNTILKVVAFTALLVASAGLPAYAGANLNHKVAIHILPHETRSCAENFPSVESCEDIISSYQGCGDIDVMPVFYELTAVSGIDYGIEWPAEWGSCAFMYCAGDAHIGSIVDPGDGVSHLWFECQDVTLVVAGCGWLSATGRGTVSLLRNSVTGYLGTTDCMDIRDTPIDTVSAGVCGLAGDDPCDFRVDRRARYWGDIKVLFE
jgi:hypothetical protein